MFGSYVVYSFFISLVQVFAVPSGKLELFENKTSSKTASTKGGRLLLRGIQYHNHHSLNGSHSQALAYWKAQCSEIATVTGENWIEIRNTLGDDGVYWIDGMDKTNDERFSSAKECPTYYDKINFSGIPENFFDIPASSCLSIVKGVNFMNFRIQAVPCSSKLEGVVCAFKGGPCSVSSQRPCNVTTNGTTTTPGT